jgi:hypothetical protein
METRKNDLNVADRTDLDSRIMNIGLSKTFDK